MNVKRNAQGRLIGESHPKAKLTDAEVETIRTLYETERVHPDVLALIFECSKHTVRNLVFYRRR